MAKNFKKNGLLDKGYMKSKNDAFFYKHQELQQELFKAQEDKMNSIQMEREWRKKRHAACEAEMYVQDKIRVHWGKTPMNQKYTKLKRDFDEANRVDE